MSSLSPDQIATPTVQGAALYLVGVAAPGTLRSFTHPGLEDGQVTTVRPIVAFDAITIELPAEVFTGDDAESRLRDIAWLTPRAERHEGILRAARARTTVFPVGFGSVFSTGSTLAESLTAHSGIIGDFFGRAGDCDEWSLKVSGSRKDLLERARRRFAANSGETRGVAYLRARQLDEAADALARDSALDLAESLIDSLGPHIEDAAERRAIDTAEDRDDWTIAHVALLIQRDNQNRFDAALDSLAPGVESEGLRIELSGPWAPYSFAAPIDATDDDHTPC
ncbi:MAG: GvpL/GvpF family gas vesicle protein [Planctomycetota bacterium]